MASPIKVLVAAAALALVAAAPAAADTTAPTAEPVAHIFKFTTKSVKTTGAAPQLLVRVDEMNATTASARLVFTPTTKGGKRRRGAKKVSVNLGTINANEVANPAWPATKRLAKGYYSVKLNATTSSGAKLTRPTGSPGTTKLTVVKGKALAAVASATGTGARMVQLAQPEVGQAEIPKGSNNSPRIAQYRAATPGAPVGAWCAYFISYLAKTAGSPVGDSGQGYGRVDDLYAWAKRTGKAIPAAGVPIAPGDFMVWDEHIGIVESVALDGTITTIDGNYGDAVTRRVLPTSKRGGVLGYVRL